MAANRIYDVRLDQRGYSPPRGCVALAPTEFTFRHEDELVIDGEIVMGEADGAESNLFVEAFAAWLKSTTSGGLHVPHVNVDTMPTIAVEIGSANLGDTPSATQAGVVVEAIRDDGLNDTLDADGKLTALRVNSVGRLYTTAAVTEVIPGTGATNLAKLFEATVGDLDAGVSILVRRRDAPAALSSGSGKYEWLQVAAGGLWTRNLPTKPVIVTPTLDTNIYAAGDVLFTATAIAAATLENNGYTNLKKLVLFDGDAQGAAMDIYILQDSTTIGTINAAPTITDANLDPPNLMDVIGVASGDWKTISGAKVCSIDFGEGLPVQAGSATTTIYIAAVTQGTPTHTASGIVISAWFKP